MPTYPNYPSVWTGNLPSTMRQADFDDLISLRKAGLTAWPKLFQNLRATRQTELAGLFPLWQVCAWLGNSEAVATKHYLQVTDAHFEAACSALQNPVQSAAEPARTDSQAESQTPISSGESDSVHVGATEKVRLAGFEPATYGLGMSNSDAGTVGAATTCDDAVADLAFLVRESPDLDRQAQFNHHHLRAVRGGVPMARFHPGAVLDRQPASTSTNVHLHRIDARWTWHWPAPHW